MNEIRIIQYVDGMFEGVKADSKVAEQKEELIVNITERVRDYMRDGLSFDEAFDAAKNIIGDTDELTAPFEKAIDARQYPPDYTPEDAPRAWKEPGKPRLYLLSKWQLTALSPFIYVLFGLFFGWWAWGWVIIPMSAIFNAPMPLGPKLPALSPFIYFLLGYFFGWWAWGWIIIPVAGILFAGKAAVK